MQKNGTLMKMYDRCGIKQAVFPSSFFRNIIYITLGKQVKNWVNQLKINSFFLAGIKMNHSKMWGFLHGSLYFPIVSLYFPIYPFPGPNRPVPVDATSRDAGGGAGVEYDQWGVRL